MEQENDNFTGRLNNDTHWFVVKQNVIVINSAGFFSYVTFTSHYTLFLRERDSF